MNSIIFERIKDVDPIRWRPWEFKHGSPQSYLTDRFPPKRSRTNHANGTVVLKFHLAGINSVLVPQSLSHLINHPILRSHLAARYRSTSLPNIGTACSGPIFGHVDGQLRPGCRGKINTNYVTLRVAVSALVMTWLGWNRRVVDFCAPQLNYRANDRIKFCPLPAPRSRFGGCHSAS